MVASYSESLSVDLTPSDSFVSDECSALIAVRCSALVAIFISLL